MTFLEILVEGSSDVPTVTEILRRRFGLRKGEDFRIHPHRGKGKLPERPRWKPQPTRQGLLDQLPAKLRAYGRTKGFDRTIVVLVDADDDDCRTLKSSLLELVGKLDQRPKVLFRIAIEEIESWFLADKEAIRAAYPRARLNERPKGKPDQVIGAWERLASVLSREPRVCTGADKTRWAQTIAPLLDLDRPRSPSLGCFVAGVAGILGRSGS